MNPRVRILVVLVLAIAATLLYLKRPAVQGDPAPTGTVAEAEIQLPRLVDLGADKCVPCKMMAPILAELKTEFAATFAVQFIDVWKNPEAAQPYGIRVIPTQIFFAADGSELFRHEGFFSREDILAKWRELGVEIGAI